MLASMLALIGASQGWVAGRLPRHPAARALSRCAEAPDASSAAAAAAAAAAADCEACVEDGYVPQQHNWESLPNPQFDYTAAGDSDWLLAGAAALSQHTAALAPQFAAVRERPFFRFFAVDLLASCGYVPQNEVPCELDACEIEPTEDVPPPMMERDANECASPHYMPCVTPRCVHRAPACAFPAHT